MAVAVGDNAARNAAVLFRHQHLGGLEAGLYILGGAPGFGKTTVAFHIASGIAAQCPVLYVTFENSPANLTMKALAARARVNLKDIRRGLVEPSVIARAANEWREASQQFAFITGNAKLTIAQVRGRALELMNRHQAKQCLIVVDYLQMAAKHSAELRGLGTIREKVEAFGAQLRTELAVPLNSPVLAISSLNRAAGDYGDGNGNGNGNGKPRLDSLKESGDLEYQADVVMFLAESQQHPVSPVRAVTLTIKKNRNGEVGAPVELIFRPDIATIRERGDD